jgi:MoxR-like ATPase
VCQMASFGILGTVLKRSKVAAEIELLTRKPRLLIGPPGVGKTHLAYTLGEQLGLPVYKFACTEMATGADLIGGNQADPYGRQPLWWVPGHALTAMGYGLVNPETGERPLPGILLVDDMHKAANADVLGALLQVLDCGPGGNIMLPTGQTIHAPGPDKHRVICTANGEIDSFDEAIRSRLGGSILVNEPSREQLAALQPRLLARCCMADYKRSTGPLLSYRHWLNLSELWGLIDLATAVMVATDSNQQLAASLVEVLATEGCQEAGALLTEMAAAAPSGAPGGV